MNKVNRVLLIVVLIFVVATQFGNGCASTTGGYDRGGDYGSGGSYDGPRVPRDARLVEEGRGVIRFRAPEDGQVFLFDRHRGRTIADFRIRRGREFIVSPKDNRAWMDNDRVLEYNFDRDHTHQIYYRSDRGGDNWDDNNGSSGGRPDELRGADRVAYGRGDLSFNARSEGRAIVYDVHDRRIVYRSDVRRGDRVLVSPADNYITIGDAKLRGGSNFRLNPKHDYEVYFKSSGRSGDGDRPIPDKPRQPDKPIPDKPTFDDTHTSVPKSARIIREGKNTDLSFEADAAGTCYIYDVDGQSIVGTYRLKKGQRFTVTTSTGDVAVDGKSLTRKSMSSKKNYRLYFDSAV